MPNIYYSHLKIKDVDLWFASCDEGLVSLGINESEEGFLKELEKNYNEYTIVEDSLVNQEVSTQISEYFNGKRKEFTLPIKLEGTEFEKKVWNELINIPYGTVVSYKDIAIKINNEKAYRAVGMANNKNKLAIVVPCHRVIGANGALVGYAGGLEIKKKLLGIEGVNCVGDKIMLK